MPEPEVRALLEEARALDFVEGWGTGLLAGRVVEDRPPWDWPGIVRADLAAARTALDLGTGDGAVLASYGALPPLCVAQEAWAPTLPAAVRTLRPLGVYVLHAAASPDNTDDPDRPGWPGLPFAEGTFDVVVARHECYSPRELRRVLAPGGVFCTQQAGSSDAAGLRELLGLPPQDRPRWDLPTAAAQLRSVGLRVTGSGEAFGRTRFADVGALAAYLRAVPWEVPEFTVDGFAGTLARLHRDRTDLVTTHHRFWLTCT